jgi:hypothetical protein
MARQVIIAIFNIRDVDLKVTNSAVMLSNDLSLHFNSLSYLVSYRGEYSSARSM